MSEDTAFQDLLRRVRAGDPEAAAELVRQYEPEIRRAVRIRLSDPRLGRLFDSVDICQSVLANFFVRVTAGQFDLDQPEQLLRLLVTMARNKFVTQVHKQRARCRDVRRVQVDDGRALEAVAQVQATPSEIVAGKELLEKVRQLLSAEEIYLAEQRAAGRRWHDIAAELSSTPGAVRKKLERALDRVSRRLGLDG